jgi:hypothetical protein
MTAAAAAENPFLDSDFRLCYRRARGGPGMDRSTRARARRMLDVEDVVSWACQELARKRMVPASRTPIPALAPREAASLVGRWTAPPGFPSISPMFAPGFAARAASARGAPPDGDAFLVEAAIGAMPGRLAGLPAPDELALDIGGDVDVEGAFAAALRSVEGALYAHGRLGSRPVWDAGPPRASPKLAANGKPGVWRTLRIAEPLFGERWGERDVEEPVTALKRRDVYPEGAYGVIEWDPPPQVIVNARADYLAWRIALDGLAEALSGRLERLTALPPAAALTPWRGDRDGDKPRDLFGAGAERVYSAREQMALAARRANRARRPLAVGPGFQRRPARPEAKGRANGE